MKPSWYFENMLVVTVVLVFPIPNQSTQEIFNSLEDIEIMSAFHLAWDLGGHITHLRMQEFL